MNTMLISANVLVLITFFAHTLGGDKAYKEIEPPAGSITQQKHWTMGRGAFQIVSADFLLAFIGLTIVNFTDYIKDKKLLLYILTIYFTAYGLAFLITLIISRKFPEKYVKLPQWLLLFIIAGLIFCGI